MTTISLLCSGTPTPSASRFGTAFALQIEDEDVILIDCGPAATLKLALAGYSPANVSTLFLTHHHYDHNGDVPCFLLSRWDKLVSNKPICIYGPSPTTTFIERLIGPHGAYQPDYYSRMHWSTCTNIYTSNGGTLPRQPPAYHAMDIVPGYVMTVGSATVTAGYAAHAQPYLDCLAYRFDTPAGSVVFSGDTEYCKSIVELAKGADILFCMALGDNRSSYTAMAGVTDSRDAGRIAADAEVKRLVLTHQAGGANRDEEIRWAGEVFNGEVVFGDELLVITL
ncbi:hypothetical protein ASPZODRAFT_135956 [Penicilliopsis zonata CBS 506.65]|uniref:Metallo-beta-lactamase domain-containing protein n=1 Tax=Penicilliopsis zonata CBS 506.65 TaxID=1073090 RepID=A0A1L9S8K4_9EURO|nr:hypothetical protein ASPZODRAFT_135956 [Penicilliopsis zonata CBS 506.65]OJJ43492.1 hypothetical protein ASPZODRAFT_135956 [Penicilliopsis zonata CBS 506.65]